MLRLKRMKPSYLVLGIGIALAASGSLSAAPARTDGAPPGSSIPYVATRNDAVRDMLYLADVGKDDVVYDLGSGDGRIVIAAVRDFGARRAVGIEIDPERVRASIESAQKAGVADRVKFIQGDLFTNDFSQATVLTLFLGHEPNLRLRPRIFSTLKPGTRVVSHQYAMGEWQPDKALTVRTVYLGMWGEQYNPFGDNPRVPDYSANERHYGTSDRIAVWVVPAAVAGIWRSTVETAQGAQDFQLVLHQRLSEVAGSFEIAGQTNLAGRVHADVWGDHVRYECEPDHLPYGQFQLKFDGHIRNETMQGTLSVYDHGQHRERAWEAQRAKADPTGTWEWPAAMGTHSVRLRIEGPEGHRIATYLDREETVPVTDFYDYGGGLYFTHMIGREGNSIRGDPDTGWLIGEAVADHGALKGKIEFYPYHNVMLGPLSGRKEAPTEPIIRDWTPQLVKP